MKLQNALAALFSAPAHLPMTEDQTIRAAMRLLGSRTSPRKTAAARINARAPRPSRRKQPAP